MCDHKVCLDNSTKYLNKGVGIIIFNNYTFHASGKIVSSVLLGKEKRNCYKGQYNLCSGKLDHEDKNCWIKAAIRELDEEFKIKLSMSDFEEHFKDKHGDIDYIILNRTPIFIGKFPRLSRKPLNLQIIKDLSDHTLPYCYKEIENVDWFTLVNIKGSVCLRQIEGYKYYTSIYALRAIEMAFAHMKLTF